MSDVGWRRRARSHVMGHNTSLVSISHVFDVTQRDDHFPKGLIRMEIQFLDGRFISANLLTRENDKEHSLTDTCVAKLCLPSEHSKASVNPNKQQKPKPVCSKQAGRRHPPTSPLISQRQSCVPENYASNYQETLLAVQAASIDTREPNRLGGFGRADGGGTKEGRRRWRNSPTRTRTRKLRRIRFSGVGRSNELPQDKYTKNQSNPQRCG